MGKIRVKKVKSTIAAEKRVRKIMETGLGLRKIGHEKVFPDNNCIRGMVNKVIHLVEYKLEK